MIPPSPFCVTTTPNCFKLAFPYHPRLVELVKRIPSVKQNIRAAYIADEKAWKVSLQDKEYVRMMADWAVQTRICSRVQHKVTTREYNDYTIPDLPNLRFHTNCCWNRTNIRKKASLMRYSTSGAYSGTNRDWERHYRQ